MEDSRNVINRFKGIPLEDIVQNLDQNGIALEIAIDNVEHDFNMGTIVRSANAFGVRTIHIIGRKQWNKRGAMMTDKYLHIVYHSQVDDFIQRVRGKHLIAIDNVEKSTNLASATLPVDSVLLFGAEKSGIRPELLETAEQIIAIEQFGSTRSINVGVAAGIAMYAWLTQNVLD